MTIRVTARGSNLQNNTISNMNTKGGHFLHFGIIGANPFEGFKTFRGNNNNPPLENNNNNNLLPLPLPGFEKGLGKGFNPSSGENVKGLDLNVAALVNALIGTNLSINYVERESNHVKPIEFEGTEAEDPNEWLECYNKIAETNK